MSSYLNIKIKEGDAHNIVCPAVDCNILVPVEFIETVVSSKMAKRYLQFDIKVYLYMLYISRYQCIHLLSRHQCIHLLSRHQCIHVLSTSMYTCTVGNNVFVYTNYALVFSALKGEYYVQGIDTRK